MTNERILNIVKIIAAVFLAPLFDITGAAFSLYFMHLAYPSLFPLAVLLVVGIPVLKLVFVQEGLNHSWEIIIAGLFAYGYDIATDTGGFLLLFSFPFIVENAPVIVLALGASFCLSVLPAKLLMWGLQDLDWHSAIGTVQSRLQQRKEIQKYRGVGFDPSQAKDEQGSYRQNR